MATTTSNLGLTLPSVNDAADIAVLNSNFQKIDGKIPAAGAAPVGYATENAWADTYSQFIAKVESVYASMGNMTRRMLTIGLGADGDIARGSWFVDITRFYESYGLVEIYNENKRYIRKLSGTWGGLNSYDPSAFAPSGYGYGGGVPYVSVSDMWTDSSYNTALDGLLSGMKDGEAKQIRIPYIDGTTTLGTVYRAANDYATVVCYGYGSYGFIARKNKYNGYWTDWEWENPPMSLGTEYKTTERYQGNPVYTKLVDLGESANLKVVYVLEGNARIIRHEAMYGGTTSLPFINDTLDNGYSIWTLVDKGGVAIKMCCGTYRIGGAMTAQIWYTK